jgi:hypothetical protein
MKIYEISEDDLKITYGINEVKKEIYETNK